MSLAIPINLTGCDTPVPEQTVSAPEINPDRNLLQVAADDVILWNGTRVALAELEDILKHTAELAKEPELEFRPELDASYELSAEVLRAIKGSGVTKFGFVGNEKYRAVETDHDEP